MSWTVACFCGNLYSATDLIGRCDVCGSTLSDPTADRPPAHDMAAAAVKRGSAAPRNAAHNPRDDLEGHARR